MRQVSVLDQHIIFGNRTKQNHWKESLMLHAVLVKLSRLEHMHALLTLPGRAPSQLTASVRRELQLWLQEYKEREKMMSRYT